MPVLTTTARLEGPTMTMTGNPCAPGERFIGREGNDQHPVCFTRESFPDIVLLPERAEPVEVATSTPTPTTTTVTPAPPATTSRSDADTGVSVVLIVALIVAGIAAVVVAGAALVRRDDHARAAWVVLCLGLRRAAWPLRAPFLIGSWCPAGLRLLLALAVLVAYGVALIMLVDLFGLTLPALLVLLVLALGGGHKLIGWKADPEPEPEAWWSERVLLGALRSAGVLPPAKADAPPVTLRRFGAPQHDDHGGTSVKLGLPSGVTASSLMARREALAAALGVPMNRLDVRHDPDESPNVVTVAVLPQRPTGTVASPLATATATRWQQPVRIGVDVRGSVVTLATTEENVLIAGRPGAGKTTTARVVLAHYLLDASAEVFLLDGKGSARDYGAARALCSRYVSGADEDAVPATEALLEDVLSIVRHRNAASGDGTVPGGLLVLLEELQDVRAAADKATRERIDSTLGRIVRMGRAVGVSVLVSTQRPSVDDLPSGVRNLISQRLALMLRNGSDAALVLGQTPELPLPTKRGEALLTTATGTTAVALDHLSDDAWEAVCARAASLRPRVPPAASAPASAPPAAAPVPVPVSVSVSVPVPILDPTTHAVVEVLRDSDPRGLSATALLGMLPGWLALPTAAHLGRHLARHGVGLVERGHVGSAPVWRLTLGEASVVPRCNPRTEGTEGSGATEAQVNGIPGDEPSVASVATAGGAA